MVDAFVVHPPAFDDDGARATFTYSLGDLNFAETLEFPPGGAAPVRPFRLLLNLTAFVLGVSYFKLRAPLVIASGLELTGKERDFVLDVYENGLGEFYARNRLERFGRLTLDVGTRPQRLELPRFPNRALVPIGGGKDSLVTVQLLEAAGVDFTPFAVNPRGPILTSIERIGRPAIYVRRKLDDEMIRLSSQTGYYTGHVPSTAINSMIGALCCLLYGYNQIVLSNERSASEGNAHWDGREVNHQYSKSLDFEERTAGVLGTIGGGLLHYYSLLRPYSEARITRLFARSTRFDDVFSSCNRNFRYNGHDGPLWCGECPKCHFVFLMLAPAVDKARLIGIFGKNLLAEMKNERSFRELTGLAGQKPWECVGEILEAAASLWDLTTRPDWRDEPIVQALKPDLLAQYGEPRLRAALAALMLDSPQHHIPADLAGRVSASLHAS